MSGYIAGTVYGATLNQSSLPTGSGHIVGQQEILHNGPNGGFNKIMLLRNNPSGATLALGAALKAGTAFETSFTVDCTTNTGELAIAITDLPTSTVAAGNYFYGTLDGLVKPLLAASISAGTMVACGATDGQLEAYLDPAVTTFFQQGNIQCQADSGGSAARTLCWMT